MKTQKLFSRFALSVLLTLLFNFSSKANNVQITGTTVDLVNSTITFNISWDNSWYANAGAPNNWDAVWVFVKNQNCTTRLWAHTGLSMLSADHSTSSPLQVDAVTDGKGVFIHRSAAGGGSIASTSVTLKMTGISATGSYNFKVFGVEMVNVPQGAFKVGDASVTGSLSEMDITSDGALTAAALGGTPTSANVPLAYPVGFNSFYAMKYEISQEQYADFLNSLTYDQQKSRTVTDPISAAGTYAMSPTYANKNGIRIITSGSNNAIPAIYACDATAGVENNIDDGQNVAMNMLNWADVAAYLDWSALRPMTELEFEKICRGAAQPRVAGEYPWGTTEITYVVPSNVTNLLKPNEGYNTAVNGLCNISYVSAYVLQSYGYPLRVGFSATGTSGRASSGAAFYGSMQMGGNVSEVVVNTTTEGVNFTGALGDGTLLANGISDVLNWPTSTSTGVGIKGGSFATYVGGYSYTGNGAVRVSDRSSVNANNGNRASDYGGRGVR